MYLASYRGQMLPGSGGAERAVPNDHGRKIDGWVWRRKYRLRDIWLFSRDLTASTPTEMKPTMYVPA
jgi:hypothetical protein